MKIIDFHVKITKIIKINRNPQRIMKNLKIIEVPWRITKIMKIHINPRKTHENIETPIIPRDIYENHENY